MNILKRKFKRSVFIRMLTYSLLPIIIVFIILTTVQVYQSVKLREKTVSKYLEGLKSNLVQVENYINLLVDGIELLCTDENIMELITAKHGNYEEKIAKNYNIQKTLVYYKNMYDFISNISVVNRNGNYVIDSTKRTDVENYYSNIRVYDKYDYAFWKEIDLKASGYEIYPPTEVTDYSIKETVFPMVISRVRDISIDNLVVIDLKYDVISDVLRSGVNADDSTFFMVSEINEKSTVFSGELPEKFKNDKKLLKQLRENQIAEYSFDGEKYFIVSHKDKSSFMNQFRYCLMLPEKSLLQEFNSVIKRIYFFMFLVIIVVVFVCFYLSKKLYNPLAEIVGDIKEHNLSDKSFNDEFELLSKAFCEIINLNSELDNKLEKSFSLINEKKLLGILNSKGYINSAEIDVIFKENNFFGKNRIFCVVCVRLDFTPLFYDNFSQEQYINISDKLYVIFESYFNDKRKSILLLQGNENFVIVFDADKTTADSVFGRLKKFADIFENDKELVKLSAGIGSVYSGYDGMRKSYAEGMKALEIAGLSKERNVIVYKSENESVVQYSFTFEQESTLMNYMIKGDSENVSVVIERLSEENPACGEASVRRLYDRILQTALRAATVKGVKTDEICGRDDANGELAFGSLDINEFVGFVENVVKKVTESSNIKVTHKDMSGLIEYIDKHYAEEIYLGNMAEKLNTSPKYLSRIVKEQLGVNFSQYVAGVRIQKAKQLLVGTNKTVNEIMELTGFTMRNTFIRTFRKFEGVTPSEYRKMMINDITKELKSEDS